MISILCIAALLMLAGSEYGWMTDFAPSTESAAMESDGNRALVRTMLLVIAFGASGLAVFATKTRGERLLPLVLCLLTLGAYAFSSV
jgi:hypothetical protein